MKSKILLNFVILGICLLALTGCNNNENKEGEQNNKSNISSDTNTTINEDIQNEENSKDKSVINPLGTTLATRVNVPEGYTRTDAPIGSFTEFIRNYEMKEDGSKVLLYNGQEKGNQSAHAAVFKLPIENYDLQQCADSIMRMFAEYYWNTKQYDKISFHFVSGFEAKFSKWRQGNNIAVNGNTVSWVADGKCNDSYESFVKYLRMVFNYASTLSMDKESNPIDSKDIQVGDIFILGGSPGHVVMVVDTCVDASGNKAFLLAQGYMPAQEFHVLKNPNRQNDIWYYENEIAYPFSTPEYSFDEGSLKRLVY